VQWRTYHEMAVAPLCPTRTGSSDIDAAAATDESALMQRTRRPGDADSTDPEHEGEELVCDMERVRTRAILRHQQRAARARLARLWVESHRPRLP
jgi:hypothetical protein